MLKNWWRTWARLRRVSIVISFGVTWSESSLEKYHSRNRIGTEKYVIPLRSSCPYVKPKPVSNLRPRKCPARPTEGCQEKGAKTENLGSTTTVQLSEDYPC